MATNIEILRKLDALEIKGDARADTLEEVRKLAELSDRALRGYNGNVGLVARVVRNERALGWFIGIMGLAVTGAVVPQAVTWIKSLF